MTNFKRQERLCRNCKRVWFRPLFAAHWVHCVDTTPPDFWDTWKQAHPEYSATAEKEDIHDTQSD